ncbi:MAG: hypothetical protein MJ228_00440 [Bacilli bacterium]|nr:hypothetical protein [Bacilli bacterium]
MKQAIKKLRQIFSYRKNWFIFILSFIVIFSSTLVIDLKYSEVQVYETISSYFPDNLLIDSSTRYLDKESSINSKYRNCTYFEVLQFSQTIKNPTNLDVDEDARITILGVDNNFFNCPILPDNNKYGFNKLYFSGDVSYSEEAFRDKGMFAVIPEGLIKNDEFENFKICGKSTKIIGTYTTAFESSEMIIILPITTLLDTFSLYLQTISAYLYIDRSSTTEISNYALLFSLNKDRIISDTNAFIKNANDTLSLFIALCFIASVSICILCVFSIKNRYHEIGIKLAIGASKIDILLELMVENMIVILTSSLGAFLLSIFCSVVIESLQTIRIGVYSINIYMPIIVFCLSVYIISSFIFVFITSLIGVNSNIEGMLKEER